jgi:hypothetical protein
VGAGVLVETGAVIFPQFFVYTISSSIERWRKSEDHP